MIHTSFLRFSKRGFTIVELMVSVSIILVMTGILLENYPESSIRITLLNNTHTLALLLREAQVRGSAVDSSNYVIGGYGLLIDSATSSQAILFGDSVSGLNLKNSAGFSIGDGLYDKSVSPDTVKEIFAMKRDFSFKKLCVASSTASLLDAPRGYLCNATSTPEIKSLTISFSRPSQNAHIYINNSTSTDYTSACVQLYSSESPASGHVRSVLVYHSGMVMTSASSCD